MEDFTKIGLDLSEEEFEKWTKVILSAVQELREEIRKEKIPATTVNNIENYQMDKLSYSSWMKFYEPEIPQDPIDPSECEKVIEKLKQASRIGSSIQHGSCFAFVPGSALPLSAITSLFVQTINKYPCYFHSSGYSRLEANCIRWFCELVGFDLESSSGIFVSGSSLANMIGIICSRDKMGITYKDFGHIRVYTTNQTHCCIEKGLKMLGFPHRECIREVKMLSQEEGYIMDTDHLTLLIEEDLKNGLKPFLIVGNLGSVNLGSVDNCEMISKIAERYKCRFHIDAAIGGFYKLTEAGVEQFKGMEHCDSIAMDLHKSLLMPYGLGVCLVKDRDDLVSSFAISTLSKVNYIPKGEEIASESDMQKKIPIYNFFDVSPEMTRPVRGVCAWLPLKIYGFNTFKAELERHQKLAQFASDEIVKNIPELKVLSPLKLGAIPLVVFRWFLDSNDHHETCNQKGRRLLFFMNRAGNFCTSTMHEGYFSLRIMVMNILTKKRHIEKILADIKRGVREIQQGKV